MQNLPNQPSLARTAFLKGIGLHLAPLLPFPIVPKFGAAALSSSVPTDLFLKNIYHLIQQIMCHKTERNSFLKTSKILAFLK